MQITIHKTFSDDGEPLYFVAQPSGVTELTDAALTKLLATMTPSETTIRITNISTAFMLVKRLREQGFMVVSCHWHATGIAKNLDAGEITRAFDALDAAMMTPVILRDDIFQLRQMIAARYAVLDFRRASQLKLKAIARTLGLTDNTDEWPAYLEAARREADEDKKSLENPITKAINTQAAAIPECVMLNEILGIKGKASWMTSASVVAYVGDVTRFATVSKLWKFAGWDVSEGKASKRAKGQVLSCNPKLKTALWSWCDSMLKTGNVKWRPVYDAARDAEILIHEAKCSRCAGLKSATDAQKEKKRLAIQSHAGARARRKVIKSVLREYFVKVRGVEDRACLEDHSRYVGDATAKSFAAKAA